MMRVSLLLCLAVNVSAFSTIQMKTGTRQCTTVFNSQTNNEHDTTTTTSSTPNRRNILQSLTKAIITTTTATTSIIAPSFAVEDDKTRGGVPLTPFNGLAFNYRGGTNQNGLDASTLDEPSVSYMDFLKRLDEGDVAFVEFLAPNGDAAYVTFVAKEGEEALAPIRIGEGYPIEDPEGWSSPAFVVKSVKKKGVPYKFTVPGLAKYRL